MVLNDTNKNNSILLEVLASVFTVFSYFPDNPRTVSGNALSLAVCCVHNSQALSLTFTIKQPTNKLKTRILSETSILYLIRRASFILIVGLYL